MHTRDHLSFLLQRELDALAREVNLYPSDETLWHPVAGQPNTGGTLVLHLCGNLRHFVGAVLGGSGYVRHRPAEFSTRDVSRAELLSHIEVTKREVGAAMTRLTEAALAEPFPVEHIGVDVRVDLLLMHLQSHLAFHLGQIDYHRRAATGDAASASPISADSLARMSVRGPLQ